MVHAMTFSTPGGTDAWNTRDDWGLALMTQPVFNLPPVKTHIIDLPGGNGVIDLSQAITGYPVYGNRTGSFTFVAPAPQARWQTLLSEIADVLHGQYMKIVLDDAPDWYYLGHVSLDIDACERQYGTIVVNYDVEPFAWYVTQTNEPWLWDPFSFVDGVIGNGTYTETTLDVNYPVSTTETPVEATVPQTGYTQQFLTFTAHDEDVELLYSNRGWGTGFLAILATLTAGTPYNILGLELDADGWVYNDDPIDLYADTESGTATLNLKAYASYRGGDAWSHIPVGETAVELNFYPDNEETGDSTHTGLWPRSAAGSAPVQVTFEMSTVDATLDVRQGGDMQTVATQTLTAGTPAAVPGLVLYRGKWLYDGREARVVVYTASSSGALAMTFREGRL